MYVRSLANRPATVPRRVISMATAQRVARIAIRRHMTESDLSHVLFTVGYGRKSLALVLTFMGVR